MPALESAIATDEKVADPPRGVDKQWGIQLLELFVEWEILRIVKRPVVQAWIDDDPNYSELPSTARRASWQPLSDPTSGTQAVALSRSGEDWQ